MNHHHRDRRKIDPSRGARRDDGTENDGDRMEIGTMSLALREWETVRPVLPVLARMRAYRLLRPVGGEILAFDTDLVGPHGICADLIRNWWPSAAVPPRSDRVDGMRHAREHVPYDMANLRRGTTTGGLNGSIHVLRSEFQGSRYRCQTHGLGLCDERRQTAHCRPPRAGCLRRLRGRARHVLLRREAGLAGGGRLPIELEDQGFCAENGVEILTRYPFDPRLTE